MNEDNYEANFVKIAVNVLRGNDSDKKELPQVLRSFFGEKAGQPGTGQRVKFEFNDGIYRLSPLQQSTDGPTLWREYMREDIPPMWGLEFNKGKWQQGFVSENSHMFLLVAMDKAGMAQEHQYADRFLAPDLFQ